MGRGVWIGIGVVIGIVAALVLVSVLPWISPGTAATMHLLKISTVTMPIYAGTRTVTTTATATTTVTKYLGGKVITVTSTLTKTLTMYRTVTATPHIITKPSWWGTITLRWCNKQGCGPVAKLKIHNHTLYVLIKPVYRTVTVPSKVVVPNEPMVFIWNKSAAYLNGVVAWMLKNAKWVAVYGDPSIIFSLSALKNTNLRRGALISLSVLQHELLTLRSLAIQCVERGNTSLYNKVVNDMIRVWSREVSELRSSGWFVRVCMTTDPQEHVLGYEYCTVVATDKYVLAIPCGSKYPALLIKMSVLKKWFMNLTGQTKIIEKVARTNPRLAKAMESAAWPIGCINQISWSKAVQSLRRLSTELLEEAKLIVSSTR